MIRRRFPEARISLLVDKKLAPLVSRLSCLDEIIPLDRKRLSGPASLLKFAKRIRREACDLSVDFQNTKWTHLLAYLGGIPERYGFSRGRMGFLINRPDHTFEAGAPPIRHQFRILAKLGIKDLDEELELPVADGAASRIAEIFEQQGFNDPSPKIGLVMGSSAKWPTKRWPLASFRELAGRLVEKTDARLILIGSPEDRRELDLSVFQPSDRILDLVGRTSLEELTALVDRIDILVTGDTAPLHVAGALKKKIVALFGPTDPVRHMPPGKGHVVLSRRLPCQPCYSGTCRYAEEELACLKRIPVEEVYEAVLRHLEFIRHPVHVSPSS